MSFDKHGLKQLLARALAGDTAAWNDFFGHIRRYLHAEVRKAVGPEPPGAFDGSAIVQSALRRIWERMEDQFRDGPEDVEIRRFIGWITVIVRNRIAEEFRKRRPETGNDAVQNIPEPRDRLQSVKRDRLAVAVAAALTKLPERYRQVVELFWFERLPDCEIGRRLGCSKGAAKVLRFRALRKLRSPELRTLLEECHDGRC
jgi:RNA polymerase sigma-70 factor (ECF subfamily)